MKKLTEKEKAQKEIIKKLGKALKEAVDHLDYCGYGDAWERSCAFESKLPQRLSEALELAGIKKK